ncbi:MAG: sterol desaturase family protein [Flavobacteriaceae bacterium]
METYAKILLIAIPGFLILVLVELAYGAWKKKQTYTLMDTLSSLSSGMTNIIKDVFGIGLILISYPFLKNTIAITQLEESTMLYIVAFVCIDFASYWNHRLNHSINVFWNRHIVHHSSEEFNLACALRQSVSALLGFGALFLLPAALLGIPHKVITVLAPLHLFGQFWYHTKHIGKLGWLEYIFVTPSQHRVHHAINPIYIDKNLSAIFCIWDRIFGTFQEELADEPCVYGTLKPVQTWNPLLINFQHNWGLAKDAWYTKRWADKFRLWFMPTGWRPKDVAARFPRPIVENVFAQKKYAPVYSTKHKLIALFHFTGITVILGYFLSHFGDLTYESQVAFGILVITTVFGFTSLMDGYRWAAPFEMVRGLIGLSFLLLPTNSGLWETNFNLVTLLFLYFLLTLAASLWTYSSLPKRIEIATA